MQRINSAPAPRVVAFRQNGSALDTVTVMSTISQAQIGIQSPDIKRPKSAPSSEVDSCISCQQRQNSGPVAKTFSLRCLVPLKLEQVIDKALIYVVLDIEFNRCGQVKDVALIEHVSGRVLLDTLSCLKHLRSSPN